MLRPDWMNSNGFPPISRVARHLNRGVELAEFGEGETEAHIGRPQHRCVLSQFKTSHHQQHSRHVIERMVEEHRVLKIHADKPAKNASAWRHVAGVNRASGDHSRRTPCKCMHRWLLRSFAPYGDPTQRTTAIGIVTRIRGVALSRALLQSALVSARYY